MKSWEAPGPYNNVYSVPIQTSATCDILQCYVVSDWIDLCSMVYSIVSYGMGIYVQYCVLLFCRAVTGHEVMAMVHERARIAS